MTLTRLVKQLANYMCDMQHPSNKTRWRYGFPLSACVIALCLWLGDFMAPLNLSKLTDNVTVVSDNEGRPLRAFANEQGIWRYSVTAKDVSPYYLQALFNYEDRYFYQHGGVNPLAMIRAIAQAIYYGRAVSGGSTITMQVARLLHPNKRTISGKVSQMFRAMQLEWHFSKAQILDMYLNIAPFGGPIEGVQTASYVYFDKPASLLNQNEAALLAVLPQSPSKYRPDRYPNVAKKARNKLLQRLSTFNVWPKDDLINDPIYADYFPHPNIAPLLSRRLVTKQRDQALLNEQIKFGKKDIATFIDANAQEQLEAQLRHYVNQLPAQTSAAIMVMDAHSGAVKAYLGSADFNNMSRAAHVDMIKAVRSPGSTLKPFVYGAAIDAGLIHHQSLLHDSPAIKGSYRPSNFSGGYSGPVSMQQALLRSLNLPVLQVLNHGSAKALAARFNNAGLTLHWPAHATANKALVLGGVGAKLEHLVSAYSALINEGQATSPRYTKDMPLEKRFLLSPESAWIIQHILRQQRQPGRISEQLSTITNSSIGWKTGTSFGNRDAWVIGFSGKYIIGTWVGRADASPVNNNTGSANALPLFLHTASIFASNYLPPRPNTVSSHVICWPSGLKQSQTIEDNCLEKKQAWLAHQQAPRTLATLTPELNTTLSFNFYQEPNGLRATVLCASKFAVNKTIELWPPALNSWIPTTQKNNTRLPAMSPRCASPTGAPSTLQITSIKPGTTFVRRRHQALTLALKTNQPQSTMHWFLNGQILQEHHQFQITKQGDYQLLALNHQGHIDQVSFTVN